MSVTSGGAHGAAEEAKAASLGRRSLGVADIVFFVVAAGYHGQRGRRGDHKNTMSATPRERRPRWRPSPLRRRRALRRW